jgi:hypothetical protein
MALWGTRDSFAITGTVSVANTTTTVTGNANTVFTTQLNIGDTLVINGRRRRVDAISAANNLTIGTAWNTTNVSAGTITGQDTPVYVSAEEISSNNIIGVDTTEAGITANKARGINTPGWTKYVTYTDMHGNTRHKAEPLVVMGAGVSSDAPDDTIAADS